MNKLFIYEIDQTLEHELKQLDIVADGIAFEAFFVKDIEDNLKIYSLDLVQVITKDKIKEEAWKVISETIWKNISAEKVLNLLEELWKFGGKKESRIRPLPANAKFYLVKGEEVKECFSVAAANEYICEGWKYKTNPFHRG